MRGSEGFLLFILLEKYWEYILGKLKTLIQGRKYEVKGEETNPWSRLCSEPRKQLVQIKTRSQRSVDLPWQISLRS